MKFVELRAERAKICENYFSWTNPYAVKEDTGIFGGFATKDLPEEILRENYEIDQKMLVRLDKINNILMESDANTYIDVHGKHLSIATARAYLSELDTEHHFKSAVDIECNDIFDVGFNKHSNLQSTFYDKCWVDRDEKALLDPMHLKEKRAEYRAKENSWGYDLLTKVLISDATTEVSFVE